MDIQTILVAIIGGGAVGFIEFLIRRHDEKHNKNLEVLAAISAVSAKVSVLEEKITQVEKKADERGAVSARVRILRFMDELMEDRRHSKDSYDQVMSDIDAYEKYCGDNPGFKNNQTVTTVKYIRESYSDRLKKHDFL